MAETPSGDVPSEVELEEKPGDPGATVRRWSAEIAIAIKNHERWTKTSRRIIRRYKDLGGSGDTIGEGGDDFTSEAVRFNILWSNINTLQPALYSRTPKPQIERRFKDSDPLGRLAADILERATNLS